MKIGYGIMFELKEPHVCEVKCNHTDCKANREFVNNAKCHSCKEQITPGQAYYNTDKGLQHWSCAVEESEKIKK